MKVAVVGAGASGLFVAGCLAKNGQNVTVFDGNEKAGKKIYITGKGRCNLTNLCPPDVFLQNVVRGEKFLCGAIHTFTSQDAVDFFEGLGLQTKVERGNRVFPKSDKASDVTKVLEKHHCKDVVFRFNEKVLSVRQTKADEAGQFLVKTEKGDFLFDRVVIATGGKSYSSTGSTGDGYAIARSFGHNIVKTVPSLCAVKLKDDFVSALQGVSLKNVLDRRACKSAILGQTVFGPTTLVHKFSYSSNYIHSLTHLA